MRRILSLILLLTLAACASHAPKYPHGKVGGFIGSYPNAATLTGTERIPIDQGGVVVNATPSQLSTYTLGQMTWPQLASLFSGCSGSNVAPNLLTGDCVSVNGIPAGSSGQLQYNAGGAFGAFTLGGDCTFAEPNITCTKTAGTSFAPSATTDTTNASNIVSGTLASARLPATIAANTTGNASTATALAATPTQCTGTQLQTGSAANGNANCTSTINASEVNGLSVPASASVLGTNSGGQAVSTSVASTNAYIGRAVTILPSGDSTGATDTAAINGALGADRTVNLGCSSTPFYVTGAAGSAAITVTTSFTQIIGCGRGQTVVILVPTGTASSGNVSAFKFGSTNDTELQEDALTNVYIQSADTSYTKTAVEMSDTGESVLERITIGSTTGGYWTGSAYADPVSGASGSIGIRIRGREGYTVRNIYAQADRPLVISANPDSTISLDHSHFQDDYWLQNCSVPNANIYVDPGSGAGNTAQVTLTSDTFDGVQAWVNGTYGFYWNDTVSTAASLNVRFDNVRTEQNCSGDTADQAFYIVGNPSQKQNFSFNNAMVSDRAGWYLHYVFGATIKNSQYSLASGSALDLDSTDYNVVLDNDYWVASATSTISSQNVLWSVQGYPQSAAIPTSAFYMNTGSTGTGVLVGSPTGGPEGPGSLNVSGGIYENGAAVVSGAYSLIGHTSVAFIDAAGTMGNNCAITNLPTLPTTYANAYIWLPAGAIQTSSAAGWYYFVGSSTSAGTCYNNTYASGTVTIPGSPTAFSSTGPGAWTGSTSFETGPSFSVAANSLGINGELRATFNVSGSSNTDTKSFAAVLGASACATLSMTSSVASMGGSYEMQNRGVASSQVCNAQVTGTSNNIGGAASSYLSVSTSSATTVSAEIKLGTATDYIVLENFSVLEIPN